ncbi:uncharacterized protein LTR77_009584 [Saxophila tyrrhenica]|uniref:Glycosyltransferase 2-like domain-containing protein n=1 Tax=Saxophila tyrrhenica TaxID=1690608 RepID=A0AAV9P0T8_9PEZI|nr:hypothetical protein LTR77_009584 [Saxophila tyrrhenica]
MGFLSYLKPPKAGKSKECNEKDGRPATKGSTAGLDPSTSGQSNKSSEDDANLARMDDVGLPPTVPSTASSNYSPVEPTSFLAPGNGGQAALSRPASLYPDAAYKNAQSMLDIKSDVMATWLYQQQCERLWTDGSFDEGVVVKKTRNDFVCAPDDLADIDDGLHNAVQALNVRAAMTVKTRVIKMFLGLNTKHYVPLKNGLRLQVLPNISFLPRCQKHHFAAFIADRQIMVVWDDEPRHVLDRAQKIEKALVEMIIDTDIEPKGEDETDAASTTIVGDDDNAERGAVEPPRRKNKLMSFQSAVCIILVCSALGAGWGQIAQELATDHFYPRALFILALPAQIWLALFFFQAMIGSISQTFGPVGQTHGNWKSYSGIKPKRLRRDAGRLPHLTVQLPVYKESLKAVIAPTVVSIKAAISTYEMQGGTANIFVNEDGMQVVSKEEREARQEFYDEHNIGWVARPKENKKPKEGEELYLRRGKFKKASNMNYAMWCSARVEDKINALEREKAGSSEEHAAVYKRMLDEVIEEDAGRTWADGNIRMGDYILIIDSDTRVPEGCFLDCVSEMEQSPQVAIIQYSSGVMNVTTSFFEKGITFFTNLIYTQIRYSVASGDVAPFVGHNAVLRWSAMQEIAYDCKLDGREKYWSEDTVSEDFDMALRLQTAGYLVRLGAYTGDGFKEGVSLTVYDELARWEKYAYGCSELIFHPLRYWFTRGPFTKLFRNFLTSKMPLPSKITIMAYIGTYYALASAWILTLANYFLMGWYIGYLDHFYLDSFKVYFSIILVFSALGNVSLAALRYRTGEKGFVPSLLENLMWVPLLSVFLGGISLHVSQAIISHMLSVDMSWGATSKEMENTTFFQEVPKIARSFKMTFLFCFGCAGMMIYMAQFAPPLWRIDTFVSVWPLGTIVFGHFALPILLNPGLMRFTW